MGKTQNDDLDVVVSNILEMGNTGQLEPEGHVSGDTC